MADAMFMAVQPGHLVHLARIVVVPQNGSTALFIRSIVDETLFSPPPSVLIVCDLVRFRSDLSTNRRGETRKETKEGYIDRDDLKNS